MSVDEKLLSIFESLKQDLGEGFLATDIWDTANAQPLVKSHDYNQYPGAISLFSESTRMLNKTLQESDYPKLGNYYLINLDNNNLVVVISIETFQQFILIDLSKVQMGILMSVALPNLLSSLAELDKSELAAESKAAEIPAEKDAVKDTPEEQKSRKIRVPSALREFIDALTGPTFFPPRT